MAVQLSIMREDAIPSEAHAQFLFTLISADAFVFNHGFAGVPNIVAVYLQCVTAELGYAVGDQVLISASAAMSIAMNPLQVKVALVTLPSIVNRTNATATAVTAANWNILFELEK